MSGVKNLRAMFEQRGENNPPDRGRSPGPNTPIGSPPATESPRPLPKVRTSFVAIEKDGRIGLRRENSGDSMSASSQKMGDNETTTPQSIPERSDASGDSTAQVSPFKRNLTYEPIPESPKQDTPSRSPPKKSAGTPELAPNANPDKITDEEEPKTKMLPGNPTESSAVRMSGKATNGSIEDALNGASSANTKPKTSKSPPKAVAPILTQTKTTAKALRSPLPLREQPKASSSTPEKKATATSTAPVKDATKKKVPTKQPSAVRKPASVESSASTSTSKTKPRSPTRPVKLPSSLTTHTASSASKFGAGHSSPPTGRTHSRASGNSQHLNAPPSSYRPPSRTSLGTSGGRPQKRQSSSVPRQRPSVGPPPKQTARDHPIVKKEPQVDESFLARMMRPTQSSSSKALDKAPVTPPRRQNAPVKRTAPKEVESKAKKAAAKVHATTSKPKEAKEAVKAVAKETRTPKKVAPAAAKSLTDAAAATPAAEKKEVDTTLTAEEVAPVVAQTVTAEDAIAAAKVSEATAATLPVEREAEAIVKPTAVEEVGTTAETEQSLASAAVISSAPEKVEDIEETVHETVEEPAESNEESIVGSEPASVAEETKVEELGVEEPKTETEEVRLEGEQTQTDTDPMLETY